MKQAFKNLSNLGATLLLVALAMLIVAAISSCSPKIVIPPATYPEVLLSDDPSEFPATMPAYDSLGVKFIQEHGGVIYIPLDSLMNSEKIVVDTIYLAGEEYVIHDSIPCPGGLTGDSLIRFTHTRILPGRSVPVSITVMDTVWLTRPCPTIKTMAAGNSGWPERISWLAGIAALLLAHFRDWRKKTLVTT